MKQIYFSLFLITAFLLCNSGYISGQNEPGGLYLSGKITTEQGSVDGTIIKMSRNGVALKDYNVLPDGKFNLRFEFNNDYVLIFSRKDNFPQKITISTQVPTDVLRRDRKFPPFPLDINLFTEVKGIERTFSENAVMKIYYSASVDNFINDVFYNNEQIKKLIDQAILQSQNVKKESDLLKRLSAAELAEMKKDYNDLISKAGKEFESQQYIPALGDYQAASRIFPDEQFPKDRIAEIKDLIAVLGLQGELDAVLAKKAEAEAKAKAEAEAKTKADDEAERVRKAEAQAQAKAVAEAERLKKAQAEAKAKAEAEAEAEAEKARIAKEKEDARLAVEAEKARQAARLKARSDSLKLVAEAEKVKLAEAQAKAKADVEAKIKAKAEAEAKAKAKAEAEMARIAREKEDARLAAEAEKARMAAEEKARVDAQRNQLRARYQQLINEADQLAGDQKLIEAVGKFRAALEVQPQETYPIQRIEEIRGIITKQLADKKAYDAAVVQGDQAYGKKQYDQARTSYQQALQLKSGEKYPAVMITKIDSIGTEISRLATLDKAREDSVRQAAEAEKVRKAQAEEKAKADAEAKIKAKAEAEAKAKAEAEAEKARIAKEKEDARLAAEAEKARQAALLKVRTDSLKMVAEAEKVKLAEAQAKAKVDAEAKIKAKAEAEAKAKAEAEAKIKAKAEAEAKAKAEAEAEKIKKAEAEAKAKAEAEAEKARIAKEKEDARLAAEAEKARQAALLKAKTDSIRMATELQAKAKAEALAKAKADAEAEKVRQAALLKARTDSLKMVAEAEKVKLAEAQEKAKAEAEAKIKAKAEAEAKVKAEAEAEKARIAKEKEDARLAVEAEKIRQAALLKARTDSIRLATEAQVKAKAEAEKVKIAEAQAKAKADAEAKIKAKAEAEAKAKAEAESEKARIAKEKEDARLAAEAEKIRLAARQKAIADSVRLAAEAERIKKAETEAKALAEVKAREAAEAEKARIAREQIASKEVDALYNGLISNGDSAFAQKEYNVSRAWYYKALEIQPGKPYPLKRIEEINAIIHSRLLSEADIEFQQFVDKGDEAFRINQLAVSRSWYNKALGLKPNDAYSKSQLTEIQIKIDENARGNTDQTFNSYLEQGNKAFDQKQFGVAKVWYLRARQLKPADALVRQKLEAVQKLIGGQ